jgi:excisionase family DNA binding protein
MKSQHQVKRAKIKEIIGAKRMDELRRQSNGQRPGPQPLLSIPEVANILGVSEWTLRQWLSQRRLPFIKVGRLTKIRPEDLEAFIQRHRQEAITID